LHWLVSSLVNVRATFVFPSGFYCSYTSEGYDGVLWGKVQIRNSGHRSYLRQQKDSVSELLSCK